MERGNWCEEEEEKVSAEKRERERRDMAERKKVRGEELVAECDFQRSQLLHVTQGTVQGTVGGPWNYASGYATSTKGTLLLYKRSSQ